MGDLLVGGFYIRKIKIQYLATKNPTFVGNSFQNIVLAMSYFRGRLPHNYRHRYPVSLLCSEWGQVFPRRCHHRKTWLSGSGVRSSSAAAPEPPAGEDWIVSTGRWCGQALGRLVPVG